MFHRERGRTQGWCARARNASRWMGPLLVWVVDMGRFGGASEGRGNNKKVIGRCHYCQREGHWKAECLERKADKAGSRFKSEGGGQTALMARPAKRKASEDWIIDSGASQHISAQRERFQDYRAISPLMIQIGDGSEIKGEGIGNIPLETESSHVTLRDVLYVPNIGSNLLSVAKIVDHGHSLSFTPSECQIQNTEGRVKGVREGNVYVLQAKKVALAALTNTEIAVSAETWHRRLGHQNLDRPAMALIQKAVVGLEVSETTLNLEDTRVCETCAIGRQLKETMTGKRQKVENLLECIHGDV